VPGAFDELEIICWELSLTAFCREPISELVCDSAGGMDEDKAVSSAEGKWVSSERMMTY
jgi:hypothetical protein